MGEKGVGGRGRGQIISFLIFSILCCIAVVPLLFFAATSLHGQVSTLYCSHDGGKGGGGKGEGADYQFPDLLHLVLYSRGSSTLLRSHQPPRPGQYSLLLP